MLSYIDFETLLLHRVKRETAVHGARKQERLLQRLQNNGFDISLVLVLRIRVALCGFNCIIDRQNNIASLIYCLGTATEITWSEGG